jgi:hypothetical protein
MLSNRTAHGKSLSPHWYSSGPERLQFETTETAIVDKPEEPVDDGHGHGHATITDKRYETPADSSQTVHPRR